MQKEINLCLKTVYTQVYQKTWVTQYFSLSASKTAKPYSDP